MANETMGLPVAANPFSVDVLADDAIGFELVNGTVRITFATIKMIDPAPPSNVHFVPVGRLVIGVPGAQRLALTLFDYLKTQGHDPSELVSAGEKAN